ncbi:MAG: IS200/IS605 family transposase [Akkermansia sp.]|nr:IS200/IS605 family transposase [Akkermansia sp.]
MITLKKSINCMAHTYTNINVHIIFHIKNTSCVIREEDLSRIFQYIGGIIREISGYAYKVGGMSDHIHILAALPMASSIADFVRIIKSNTSKWIKSLDAYYQGFKWQEGYGAFSVSASNKCAVIQYIEQQRTHHQSRTAKEEFSLFLEKNGYCRDGETGMIKKRDI